MPNRRTFLGTSTLAAAGVVLSKARPAAAHDALMNEPGPWQGGTLPPAIAALKPMTAGVKPITIDERRARIEKATRLMRENKIDALMLTVKGTPFIVCPKFEEGRGMEQVRTGPLDKGTEVHTWEEDESPSALIADGLRSRGLATGTLGIEETVRFVFSDNVAKALPTLRLTSGTPVTAGCRGVKSDAELALMRHASAVTLKAYEAAWKSLSDGMTQNQFAGLVSAAHQRLGYRGEAGVQVGQYSALPHGSVTPQVIREGTILLIDGGCQVEGYNSDLSRTFELGKATDRMKKVFDIEHQAQTAALKAARPGVECQAVDAAARKVIT